MFQALVELSVACERIGRFVNKLHANCMLPLHLGSNHPRALECLAKRELHGSAELSIYVRKADLDPGRELKIRAGGRQ